MYHPLTIKEGVNYECGGMIYWARASKDEKKDVDEVPELEVGSIPLIINRGILFYLTFGCTFDVEFPLIPPTRVTCYLNRG